VADLDVHFLALHEPYRSAEHPAQINPTFVHAGPCCTPPSHNPTTDLTDAVAEFATQGPFWLGDNLVHLPLEPAVLPYHPWSSNHRR
jgi:hypothetical protein